jgi:antitoxin component YwqK of YwqJK toxin-antitoxin module
VLTTSAQIDSENKSIIIPAEDINDPKEDNELLILPEEKNTAILDEEAKNEIVLPKTETLPVAKRKDFSMIKEDKFRSPVELYEKQLKNALRLKPDYEKSDQGRSTTQFFGEFHTNSKRLNIIYRDHGAQDGDLIRAYLNGKVEKERVLLETQFKGYFTTLKPGDNIIEFEALNQGSSGPNTAQFKVYDKDGKLVLESQWNLLTGVRGTFTVIYTPDEE